jgi:hypothetical protein
VTAILSRGQRSRDRTVAGSVRIDSLFDVAASLRYKESQQQDIEFFDVSEVLTSRNFTDSSLAAPSVTLRLHPYMTSNSPSRTDPFTQGCRDFLRTFTYEDILAWTIYGGPLLFMIGPAAILAHDPIISVALHSLVGFPLAWLLHRVGHRLLGKLSNDPQRLVLSRYRHLSIKLTLSQFIWMLEFVVGAAVFAGILAKRCFLMGDTVGVLTGLVLFAIGLALFFLPVHFGQLWMERYGPTMTLVGPTDEEINRSFPGLRSLSK